MKIVAAVLLLLVLLFPVLVAAWWLFPIFVVVVVWAFFRFEGRKYLGAILKPVAILTALAVIAWCWYVPWKRTAPQPVESSLSNRTVYGLFRRSSGHQTSDSGSNLALDRNAVLRTIESQRISLRKISSALEINASVNNYVARNGSSADISTLTTALANLQKEFTAGVPSIPGSLLNSRNLLDYTQKVDLDLDRIQADIMSPTTTSDHLRQTRLDLSDHLALWRIPTLFDAVEKVETALRQSFKTDIGAPVCENTVLYEQGSDSLVARQRITIDLGNHKASRLDLSGLIPYDADHSLLKIDVIEDNGTPRPVNLDDPRVPLGESKQLIVTRSFAQPHARYPVMSSHLWVPFQGISVRWPFPLTSSLQLNFVLPDDPGDSWPYILNVSSQATDSLRYIELPEDSYYLSKDVVDPPADINRIIPRPEAPRLADLASGKGIEVELMPVYLRNPLAQKIKSNLAVENLAGSLLAALFTGFGLALFGSKD
ncbi:MAG TPA: hypothetical protein VGB69_07340 [Edaphobacter sp.]